MICLPLFFSSIPAHHGTSNLSQIQYRAWLNGKSAVHTMPQLKYTCKIWFSDWLWSWCCALLFFVIVEICWLETWNIIIISSVTWVGPTLTSLSNHWKIKIGNCAYLNKRKFIPGHFIVLERRILERGTFLSISRHPVTLDLSLPTEDQICSNWVWIYP